MTQMGHGPALLSMWKRTAALGSKLLFVGGAGSGAIGRFPSLLEPVNPRSGPAVKGEPLGRIPRPGFVLRARAEVIDYSNQHPHSGC